MADQGAPTRNLRLTPTPNTQPQTDDQLSAELDAIITIGRALSHIPDAETRTRVIRWAIDRFGIDVATPQPQEEEGGDLDIPANLLLPEPHAPETLNLDGVSEMFQPAAEETRDEAVEDPEQPFTPPQPPTKRTKPSPADRLRDALHWMGI